MTFLNVVGICDGSPVGYPLAFIERILLCWITFDLQVQTQISSRGEPEAQKRTPQPHQGKFIFHRFVDHLLPSF